MGNVSIAWTGPKEKWKDQACACLEKEEEGKRLGSMCFLHKDNAHRRAGAGLL